MLVEAVVLDRQDRLFHHVRNLGDGHEVASLFAEFADQHIVRGIDAKRDLGPVVGDGVQRRQVGRGHQQRVAEQQRNHDGTGDNQSDRPEHEPRPDRTAGRVGRLVLCGGHKGNT
ncbi:hypothetical protein D3C72_1584440 [compost metagenome]